MQVLLSSTSEHILLKENKWTVLTYEFLYDNLKKNFDSFSRQKSSNLMYFQNENIYVFFSLKEALNGIKINAFK